MFLMSFFPPNPSPCSVSTLHTSLPLMVYRSPEEADKLCQSELQLLEQCLRVNPKSYCVWLHRHWVMTHSPSPDWARERKLCSIFLKYDERNCEFDGEEKRKGGLILVHS